MHGRRAGRSTIAGDADPRPRGQLRLDASILQLDGVIAWPRDLCRVMVAREITRPGIACVAGLQWRAIPADRHHEEIAEIRMPGTGEVRQRETLDGRIFITIARRMADRKSVV